ncbi:putative pentatricopeptide repeat-containing protein, mitochondrial [Datura stramonium]|uniref:Pentatricopeptide repeat-containing protein, mitochondrial n=1 Tax=Datura stramonium TaxID=4076 RepID=A0ABS8UPR9_DATST|nr:putative pentatricopeptide repeat-containing protein, mitochondrial [Datura stramonium]
MWLSILRGCVAHGNKILGELVGQHIIELDPENSGAFVQLSNILSTSKDWERSALVRRLMIEKKIHKNSGRSWSDIEHIPVEGLCGNSQFVSQSLDLGQKRPAAVSFQPFHSSPLEIFAYTD